MSGVFHDEDTTPDEDMEALEKSFEVEVESEKDTDEINNEIVVETTEKNFVTALSPEQESKIAALDGVIKNISKVHGKGSVINMGSDDVVADVEWIPSGILTVDNILGGGFARGKIYELYGPEGSGKTTLAYQVIARTQRLEGIAAYVDAEHAIDRVRMQELGINIEAVYISQPDYGEQGLEIAEQLIASGNIDILVVDSVAALVPKAEFEAEMGKSSIGLQARMMGQALRKLKSIVRKSRCCVIFINQIREKVGVMFGNPETTPGGRALKFFADVRLEIRRQAQIKSDDTIFGQVCRLKAVKNKLAPPFVESTFNLYYDHRGIDTRGSILTYAISNGIIEKHGAWLSIPMGFERYGGTKLGQGEAKTLEFLSENPEIENYLIEIVTRSTIDSRKARIEKVAKEYRDGNESVGVIEPLDPPKKKRGRPRKNK